MRGAGAGDLAECGLILVGRKVISIRAKFAM
jgi:hypothetical protein